MGQKWLYRYAIEEVMTGIPTVDSIDLGNNETAPVVPNGGIVTITNSKTTETTNLTVSKQWKTGSGDLAGNSDTVDYEVTFELQRKERDESDPVIVTDMSDLDGWETIGTYKLSNTSTGSVSEGVYPATLNAWSASMTGLTTKEVTIQSGTKTYQYRVVETKVLKDGEEKSVDIYNVTYSLNGTTVTMDNTFANEWGVELPSTGGRGTRMLNLTGILLMSLSGLGLIMRKRKKTAA